MFSPTAEAATLDAATNDLSRPYAVQLVEALNYYNASPVGQKTQPGHFRDKVKCYIRNTEKGKGVFAFF